MVARESEQTAAILDFSFQRSGGRNCSCVAVQISGDIFQLS
jgi:hypothetical protein